MTLPLSERLVARRPGLRAVTLWHRPVRRTQGTTVIRVTDAHPSSAAHERTGRCECGGVSYRTTGPLRDVFNCHCGRCRRFTGHHMAGTAVDADALELTLSATLSWYEPAPGVEYGFCRRCGSSLFWRTSGRPGRVTICAGTLDQPTGLRTTQAWWVAEAGDYHERPSVTEFEYDG